MDQAQGEQSMSGSENNLYQRNSTWYVKKIINGEIHRESLRTADRGIAVKRRSLVLASFEQRAVLGRHTFKEAAVR